MQKGIFRREHFISFSSAFILPLRRFIRSGAVINLLRNAGEVVMNAVGGVESRQHFSNIPEFSRTLLLRPTSKPPQPR